MSGVWLFSVLDVLYFSAPWCGPCKVFGPRLEESSKAHNFTIRKVNAEDDMDQVREYGVQSLPTTVWFKDGQARVSKVGALTEDAIRKVVNSLEV